MNNIAKWEIHQKTPKQTWGPKDGEAGGSGCSPENNTSPNMSPQELIQMVDLYHDKKGNLDEKTVSNDPLILMAPSKVRNRQCVFVRMRCVFECMHF